MQCNYRIHFTVARFHQIPDGKPRANTLQFAPSRRYIEVSKYKSSIIQCKQRTGQTTSSSYLHLGVSHFFMVTLLWQEIAKWEACSTRFTCKLHEHACVRVVGFWYRRALFHVFLKKRNTTETNESKNSIHIYHIYYVQIILTGLIDRTIIAWNFCGGSKRLCI